MPSVRLKGLNWTTKRLASGKVIKHWYAWRGGPRLDGEPGTPEFMASYNRAVEGRKTPVGATLATLVAKYKASPEWAKNADSTKAEWVRWLDQIADDKGECAIGDLTLDQLDDRRVKLELLEWRDQWAATPRSADYAMQVLSRVLSFGVKRGELAINAAAGVGQLYVNNRADQIWTEKEIAAYIAAAPSPEVAYVVRLAVLTGLRREDLASLAWSHVGDVAIVKPTGKSRGRKSAVVPILPETRELLREIEAQQAARHAELVALARKRNKPAPPECLTVLSSTLGQPWNAGGMGHRVIATKAEAGIDKHLHDTRGTFATRLRKAGLKASEIADVLAWDEARVKRLLATYVDRDAIVKDIAARLNKNEAGT